MDMLESFRDFLGSKGMLRTGDRVLLAVSGGIDSMVMLHLFARLGVDVCVAHCNFGLRGKESDADEAFVRKRCAALRVPFYTKKLNAKKTSGQKKISVQMAARELRYTYFKQLLQRHGLQRVALAHNLNDVAETILLNLVRGTGLAGIRGIVAVNGPVIRPLLFASRQRIAMYAKTEKIRWREDTSNRTDKYTRNKIRNKVMPVLAEINPSVLDAFGQHAEAVSGTRALFGEYVERLKKTLMSKKGGILRIDITSLKKHEGAPVLLYELLREYGFNRAVVADVYRSLDKIPGSVFLAPDYRLLKDRRHLVLTRRSEDEPVEHYINKGVHHYPWEQGTIGFRYLPLTHDFKRKILAGDLTDRDMAWLDADKLKYPLVLRGWKAGDAFYPLGMKGKKKISDFFTDRKYSLVQKRNAWLLVSGGMIAWVAGDRMDDRFKITEKSRNCVGIYFEKK